MIKYALICSKDHVFDEWFDSMADYDVRKAGKKLKCPTCGDKKVTKSLMAPAVASSHSTAPAPAPTCGAASGCATGMCPMAGRG
ncbi:MAG: DUF1178 family protein [Rhodospirillales bacterium]|nr:DUF1178 family protein [Rhodospirillales bacterium]MCW8861399.1 DUF1178 family protein [Rhodospirillales bacterium]MCW8952919.1 DUF1178 family protein [Rhodospirillales bacterium]MCW8969964.1 DUF1178 family protein [Rhodospirillales bacterium]MCW9002738.1 DUF1178 family protein [Rhodospirillales bacterium]